MVDVILLGCGGGMPMPGRFLSSVILNYKGKKILIDCGEGTQVSMKINGTGFKNIDVICITHGHGDHIVGLPGLLATIGNSGRTEPLTIIGPMGIRDIIQGLRVIVPYLPYEIEIMEQPEEGVELWSGLKINILSLNHSAPCIGYSFYFSRSPRFEKEKAEANGVPKQYWKLLQQGESVEDNNVCYTPDMVCGHNRRGIKISMITDSRPMDSIPLFIMDSDLFICEGTYGSNDDIEKAMKNMHMTYAEAACLAKDGNVEELLLTHFSPAMQEPMEFIENATNIFKNTVVGMDGMHKALAYKDK